MYTHRTMSPCLLLLTVAGGATGLARGGELTEWDGPVSARWNEGPWTNGVPTRSDDVLINATGGPYTISTPTSINLIRADHLMLDSDDATLHLDGTDNPFTTLFSIQVASMTLSRGSFFVNDALFVETAIELAGADVRFGDVSLTTNASISGLAHTQGTDFSLDLADFSQIQTSLGTTGDAYGEVAVEILTSTLTESVFSSGLTGAGLIRMEDNRGADNSRLVIGETGSLSGWDVRAERVTNNGTIASGDRVIEVDTATFINNGLLLAEGGSIVWESTLENHGEIRVGDGGVFGSGGGVIDRLDNHGSLLVESGGLAYAEGSNTGSIEVRAGGELGYLGLANSGTILVDGGLMRAGTADPLVDPATPDFTNTGSITVRNGGTLLAYNARLDMLGDIGIEAGSRMMFSSLDLAGRSVDDFSAFGGALFLGGHGVIQNGAIDLGGRSDAVVFEELGDYPWDPIGGPITTAFRDVALSNGVLGGSRFEFREGVTFSGIDLDVTGTEATFNGADSFGGRIFAGGDGNARVWFRDDLTLESSASIDAASVEFFVGGTLHNQGDHTLVGEFSAVSTGSGTLINEGLLETGGELLFANLSSVENSGRLRVRDGGAATVRVQDTFSNSGVVELLGDASLEVSRLRFDPGTLSLADLGTFERSAESGVLFNNIRIDLGGAVAAMDPDAGPVGGLFDGLVETGGFTNGQLGVEGGGVRIGFGGRTGLARIDNAALRGTVEIESYGGRVGNTGGASVVFGDDVDMDGATILIDYSVGTKRSGVGFEGEIGADLRVEFTPEMGETPDEYVFFNKAGEFEIGEGLSLTGDRFSFGVDVETLANRGRIEADGVADARVAREGSLSLSLVNHGELIESGGGTMAVSASGIVNHGLIAVRDGGELSLAGPIDNRGDITGQGEGSTLRIMTPAVDLGRVSLSAGAAAIFEADITRETLGAFTRNGATTVAFREGFDLGGGVLGMSTADGAVTIDGGTLRNGVVDLSEGHTVRYADQGFGRSENAVNDFLEFRHNAIEDVRFEGGDALLEAQNLLQDVEFISNVENLGVLGTAGGVTIGGDLLLADSSTLVITASFSENGLLVGGFDVGGLTSLGGSLVIAFESGPGIDPTRFGGRYTFLDAAGYQGAFADLQIFGLAHQLIEFDGVSGTFRLVPAPGAASLLGIGLLAASRRRRIG